MVGAQIRRLRGARGWTLAKLATEADLSSGMVSQVERGISEPSLSTLRKLCAALDTPMFELFATTTDAPIAVIPAQRRLRVQAPGGGLSYTRLTPGSGRLEVLEGTLAAGAASADEPWSHPSEECAVLTSGRLVVEVDGATYELEPGDACSFDSRLPHRYVNPYDDPATFIVSITPPSY